MPVQVIAFDLDGTLIDSNRIKRQGFDHTFSEFDGSAEVVESVLQQNRKAFRTTVIQLVLEKLHALGQPDAEPTETRVAELAERYNRFCIDGASTCPEMPGAAAALADLKGQFPLFINTATSHAAVDEILGRRGWKSHFTGLFGYPPDKVTNIKAIAQTAGVEVSSVLVVGDDDQDRLAAEACDCPFIAVTGPTAHFTCLPDLAATHLNQLSLFIQKL